MSTKFALLTLTLLCGISSTGYADESQVPEYQRQYVEAPGHDVDEQSADISNDDSDDSGHDRGYDRLQLKVEFGILDALWRIPRSERGSGGALGLAEVSVAWRPTDKIGIGAGVFAGLMTYSAGGVFASYAPRGWNRRGPVFTGGLHHLYTSVFCEDAGVPCDLFGMTSGTGGRLNLQAMYRWPLSDGGWGLQAGASIDASWLEIEFPEQHSGFYLGLTALRLGIDF